MIEPPIWQPGIAFYPTYFFKQKPTKKDTNHQKGYQKGYQLNHPKRIAIPNHQKGHQLGTAWNDGRTACALEVPMAARPATPQPSTKVCAGGYLPRVQKEHLFGRNHKREGRGGGAGVSFFFVFLVFHQPFKAKKGKGYPRMLLGLSFFQVKDPPKWRVRALSWCPSKNQ